MSELKTLQNHPPWLAWTQENLARGCDVQGIKHILLQNGFEGVSIDQALESAPPKRTILTHPVDPAQSGQAQAQAQAQAHAPHVYWARPVSTKNTPLSLGPVSLADAVFLQDPNHPALVSQVITAHMQLYLIADFMSPEECQGIIDLGQGHLRASTVSLPDPEVEGAENQGVHQLPDQTYVDLSFRTSQTCDLALLNQPKVWAMDERISQTLGIRGALSEGTQLQRYRVGEQFRAHTDYFAPNTDEYARFAAERGNRTWTFMVYLNEVAQGGGTHFVSIKKTIKPRQGMAVVWNNLLPSGEVNPETLHAGMPVLGGEKFVITKWFRER